MADALDDYYEQAPSNNGDGFATVNGAGGADKAIERNDASTSKPDADRPGLLEPFVHERATDNPKPKLDHRLSTASSASSSTRTRNYESPIVYGVCLVDFDHALGPKVQWSQPQALMEDEELSSTLPFLALPDGAHLHEEDYAYFHMLCPSISPTTIFGISCNRQIASNALLHRPADATRSTVQKAVVVLASAPIFGPLRDRLGVVTRALFAQLEFEHMDILSDFRDSLSRTVERDSDEEDSLREAHYSMGTSVRELVHRFRLRTLVLVKLLMLSRKIMFFGSQVERLCTFQYSLVSLIPCASCKTRRLTHSALLMHLEDAGDPTLDSRSHKASKVLELRTSDRISLLRYLGLPLDLFGQGSFFQPYLPLQQIDQLVTAEGYLVGTTNSIFQQQRDVPIDVLVNVDTGTVEIHDPKLAHLVALTAADRRWMDDLVSSVTDSWNESDPSRPVGMNFVGSDDYLRSRFEEYVCSALSAIKFADFVAKGKASNIAISGVGGEAAGLSHYGSEFVAAFRETKAFALWNRTTDPVLFDLIVPSHPCHGKADVLTDVGIRLRDGVHDLGLEGVATPVLAKGSEAISKGTESAWRMYSGLRARMESRSPSTQQPVTPVSSPPQIVGASVLAGVGAAQAGAASMFSGVSSFLSSKRSMFSPTTPAAPQSTLKPFALSPDPSSSLLGTSPPRSNSRPVSMRSSPRTSTISSSSTPPSPAPPDSVDATPPGKSASVFGVNPLRSPGGLFAPRRTPVVPIGGGRRRSALPDEFVHVDATL